MNKHDKIPMLFDKKEECCGCSACEAICPLGAIVMIYDEQGFKYPKISEGKCIGCQKCIEVCAFK